MADRNPDVLRQNLNIGTESKIYGDLADINGKSREFLVKKGLMMVPRGRVLEMGWMGPFWTPQLLEMGCQVDIVEATDKHVKKAQEAFKGQDVRIFHSLFEEFVPDCKYDAVLCTGVLKHCPDPSAVLRRVRNWMNDDANLIVGEPNARSFNRRLGALMGLLSHPGELTQNDKDVRNLKIFDRYELSSLIRGAGYEIQQLRGVFFKPFDNQKMNSYVADQKLLDALDEMGDELVDYAWYLLASCKKSS